MALVRIPVGARVDLACSLCLRLLTVAFVYPSACGPSWSHAEVSDKLTELAPGEAMMGATGFQGWGPVRAKRMMEGLPISSM